MNKYIVLSISITLCFCLISCKRETPPVTPSGYWGTASAYKNGHIWTGNIRSGLFNDKIGIYIDSVPESIIEALTIFRIPIELKTTPVVNPLLPGNDSLTCALLTYFYFDDPKGSYIILESDSSSYVTLESYDTITKEIKGRFDLIFIKADPPYPIGAPDTIRMTDGVFHTKILN